ncbi:MAG TPA: LiaF domain-containing protein [Polyangia bacterium]|nr:LiaF domain-containing protein [Polyangia bacterium]
MSDRTALERVHDARERVIAALSDAFARDVLDVDEFERRVTVAHTTDALPQIEALVADLPAATTALAPAAVAVLAAEGQEAPAQTVYAVFGGVERRGAWTVPRNFRVVAMMGGAVLDLREARFPRGVVDLEVKAVFGGVQILVPPGLAVEVSGSAIMGGFSHVNRSPPTPDPDAPLLRVRGLAVMGGVDISMRLPGESEGQAARRLRQASRRERLASRRDRRALPDRG